MISWSAGKDASDADETIKCDNFLVQPPIQRAIGTGNRINKGGDYICLRKFGYGSFLVLDNAAQISPCLVERVKEMALSVHDLKHCLAYASRKLVFDRKNNFASRGVS